MSPFFLLNLIVIRNQVEVYLVSLSAVSETVVRCELGKIRIMACSRSWEIRGYLMDIRGYLMDIRGYLMDIRGYLLDIRGYLMDIQGYLMDIRSI